LVAPFASGWSDAIANLPGGRRLVHQAWDNT